VRLFGIDTKAAGVLRQSFNDPTSRLVRTLTLPPVLTSLPILHQFCKRLQHSVRKHVEPRSCGAGTLLLSQGTKLVQNMQISAGSSSWQSCTPIDAKRGEVIVALEECLAAMVENMRLFGIDTKAKRRVLETIIQNPMVRFLRAPARVESFLCRRFQQSSSPSHSKRLSSEAVEQLRRLLAQGCQISTEYADERRFKTSSCRVAVRFRQTENR